MTKNLIMDNKKFQKISIKNQTLLKTTFLVGKKTI